MFKTTSKPCSQTLCKCKKREAAILVKAAHCFHGGIIEWIVNRIANKRQSKYMYHASTKIYVVTNCTYMKFGKVIDGWLIEIFVLLGVTTQCY